MASIKEKVEEHLAKGEAKRSVKDVGRVSGSRKEMAAYKIITKENIDEINEDEVIAFNIVKKDAVWPPVDVDAEKAKGVSAGAAFMKVKLREAMPAKPFNDPKARKAYVAMCERLSSFFDRCKTTNDMLNVHTIIQGTLAGGIRAFYDTDFSIAEDEEDSSFVRDYAKKIMEILGIKSNIYKFNNKVFVKLYGAELANLIFRSNNTAKEKWIKALGYDGCEDCTEKEEKHRRAVIEQREKVLERLGKIKRDSDNVHGKKLYEYFKNEARFDMSKIPLSRFLNSSDSGELAFRNKLEKEYDKALAELDAPIEIPVTSRTRPDDWSWAEKEKREGDAVGSRNKINEKQPLAYIKRVGGYRTPEPTPENIVKHFGFSAYNFGKYVPDNERAEHARHFMNALTDLGDVLNIDIKAVHEMGKLGFGVGLKGHKGHLAAYYPQTKDINLVRGKGDGSVAHEWAHFLDNVLIDGSERKAEPKFSSQYTNFSIGLIVNAIKQGLVGGKEYAKVTFKAFEMNLGGVKILGSVEESIANFFSTYPVYKLLNTTPKNVEMRSLVIGYILSKHGVESYDVDLLLEGSRFYRDSLAQGTEYWVRPQELFARAFETYVHHKLALRGMENNYLAHDAYEVDGGPYPRGAELDRLTVMLDDLIIEVKKNKKIGDFVPIFTDRIDEEIIELDNTSKESVMPVHDVVIDDGKIEDKAEENKDNNQTKTEDMPEMIREPRAAETKEPETKKDTEKTEDTSGRKFQWGDKAMWGNFEVTVEGYRGDGNYHIRTASGRKIAHEDNLEKIEPTATAPKEKEPWEMTREEWSHEMDSIPSGGASRSATISQLSMKNKLAGKDVLAHRDNLREKLKKAQSGEVEMSPEEANEIIEELNSKVSHRDVIAQALKSGKPVPAHVLADYPELVNKTSIEQAREALANAKTRADLMAVNDKYANAFEGVSEYKEYNALMKEATERVRQSEIDERKDNPFAGVVGGAKEETKQPEPEPQADFKGEGSQKGTGKLYEFFTPQEVADTMAKLAYKHGFAGGKVLEPAAGNGRLLKYFDGCEITAFEINKENVAQLRANFPSVTVYDKSFETAFMKEPLYRDLSSKDGSKTWLPEFDLVVANPPYGELTGLYASHFKFLKVEQMEHLFMVQSLRVLRSGGIGVYLVPSSFMRNGIGYNDVKRKMFEMASLVDAYRMPDNIFKHTQIGTDIIVLKKK